jgi:tetratricopeptide (TPR) repeat protein
MFGPKGHAYIFLIYGAYWCFNLTCGPAGKPQAILIRAHHHVRWAAVGPGVVGDRVQVRLFHRQPDAVQWAIERATILVRCVEETVRLDHRDSAEQTGLGKAYFAMGDYRPAKDAFRRALQIDPGEKDATRLAEVCDEILGLDPTLRGLASTERFRRSETLVRLILARMDACEPDRSQWPNSVVEAATAARTVLSHKRAPRSFAAAADRNILEATTLWAECLKLCGPPHPDDDIALILARVGPAIEPGGK